MEIDVLKGATNTINNMKPILYIENDRPDNAQTLFEYLHRTLNYLTFWSIEPYERVGINFRHYATSANVIGGGERVLFSYNILCVHPHVLEANPKLEAIVSRFPAAFAYPEQIHPLWSNRKKDFLLFLQSLSTRT
jgi:hypothetical protein